MGDSNLIRVTGRIISKKEYDDGTTGFTVASKNVRDIFPHFVTSEDISDIKARSHVEVLGHVADKWLRNGMKTQEFVADEVNVPLTMMEKEFGIHGNFYYPPESSYKLSGTIKDKVGDNGWIRYFITPDGEDGEVRVSAKPFRSLPELEKGDHVYVICNISTPMKEYERDGVKYKQYFKDLLVSDLVKAD